MTGVRILALMSSFAGRKTDYWQSDGKPGSHHDFNGDEGLARVGVLRQKDRARGKVDQISDRGRTIEGRGRGRSGRR